MLNVTVNVAFPELSSSVGPPRTLAPSFSVTLPSVTLLGFMPSVRVTVAVNVTCCPIVEGFGVAASDVFVPTLTVTVWVAALAEVNSEVDAVIVGLPAEVSL